MFFLRRPWNLFFSWMVDLLVFPFTPSSFRIFSWIQFSCKMWLVRWLWTVDSGWIFGIFFSVAVLRFFFWPVPCVVLTTLIWSLHLLIRDNCVCTLVLFLWREFFFFGLIHLPSKLCFAPYFWKFCANALWFVGDYDLVFLVICCFVFTTPRGPKSFWKSRFLICESFFLTRCLHYFWYIVSASCFSLSLCCVKFPWPIFWLMSVPNFWLYVFCGKSCMWNLCPCVWFSLKFFFPFRRILIDFRMKILWNWKFFWLFEWIWRISVKRCECERLPIQPFSRFFWFVFFLFFYGLPTTSCWLNVNCWWSMFLENFVWMNDFSLELFYTVSFVLWYPRTSFRDCSCCSDEIFGYIFGDLTMLREFWNSDIFAFRGMNFCVGVVRTLLKWIILEFLFAWIDEWKFFVILWNFFCVIFFLWNSFDTCMFFALFSGFRTRDEFGWICFLIWICPIELHFWIWFSAQPPVNFFFLVIPFPPTAFCWIYISDTCGMHTPSLNPGRLLRLNFLELVFLTFCDFFSRVIGDFPNIPWFYPTGMN